MLGGSVLELDAAFLVYAAAQLLGMVLIFCRAVSLALANVQAARKVG